MWLSDLQPNGNILMEKQGRKGSGRGGEGRGEEEREVKMLKKKTMSGKNEMKRMEAVVWWETFHAVHTLTLTACMWTLFFPLFWHFVPGELVLYLPPSSQDIKKKKSQ